MESRSDLDLETPLRHEDTQDVGSKRFPCSSRSKLLRCDDGIRPGWRPLSTTTPILSAFVIFSLAIAAVIETLAQRSKAHGGLALAPSRDEIPRYAMLSYLYGPNIVAVLYYLIWSWIDLDVKRMQPWLELSKPSGATAENSIFLDYPSDFVATVPIKAAKRRHWPVFLTGTVTVIILLFITPLQSAITGTDIVSRTESVKLAARSQLMPVGEQDAFLGPDILATGYATTWLNQPFPAFTTADYATLPFYIDSDPAPTKSETNWTTSTTKFTTELDCWPAEIYRTDTPLKVNFLNGQGCNYTMYIAVSDYTMQYIGFRSSANSDWWIGSGPDCPPTSNSTHQTLALWVKRTSTRGESETIDITALYCQPRYYKQEILVTVTASGFTPITTSEQVLSPRESLSFNEFNSSAFEYLLANGMDASPIERDAPSNAAIDFPPAPEGRRFGPWVATLVHFARAGQNRSAEEYRDPKLMHEDFERAHRRLFSVAISALFRNATAVSNHSATSTYHLSGIIVSRLFSAVVEAFLLLVAILTCLLIWSCRTAPCNLHTNPSSIANIIDIARNSSEMIGDFVSVDTATDDTLLEAFRDDKFRLFSKFKDGKVELSIERVGKELACTGDLKSSSEQGYYEPIRPVALRRDVGLGFIAVLLGAVATIAYLKRKEDVMKGLPRPSQDFEVLQILENYIPVIFSTIIQTFFVLLNRLLCVLQPFRDLWVGKAKPGTSIEADYTSIPPQLAFVRALKSKHFILAVMCSIAFLSNILAVSLGALFNEVPTVASYPQRFRPSIEPKFNGTAVNNLGDFLARTASRGSYNRNHLRVAMSNFSSGNPLPPWVSKEFFFQPLNFVDDGKREESDTYHITTRGFGINANCTPVPTFEIPPKTDQTPDTREVNPNPTGCPDPIGLASRLVRNSMPNPLSRSTGQYAFQYFYTWGYYQGPQMCYKPLTLGWGRTRAVENLNGPIDSFFSLCHPIFETAMFNVEIDSSGNVLSYNRTSNIESVLSYNGAEHDIDLTIENFNVQFIGGDQISWNNDNAAQNWMTYLAVLLTGSRSILDPHLPVPTANETIPIVEDVYRRVFVIFLSMYTHIFEPGDFDASIIGTRFSEEMRIFLDRRAFIITMTILTLDIVVAFIFYTHNPAFVLPRMPTTIGSILAYAAPSRIVSSNYRPMADETPPTFSFGRYRGCDGKPHIGIEMDPYVVPVDPKSLLRGKNGWLGGLSFLKLQSDTGGGGGQTWM